MPFFTYQGKTKNVREKDIDVLASKFPDAVTKVMRDGVLHEVKASEYRRFVEGTDSTPSREADSPYRAMRAGGELRTPSADVSTPSPQSGTPREGITPSRKADSPYIPTEHRGRVGENNTSPYGMQFSWEKPATAMPYSEQEVVEEDPIMSSVREKKENRTIPFRYQGKTKDVREQDIDILAQKFPEAVTQMDIEGVPYDVKAKDYRRVMRYKGQVSLSPSATDSTPSPTALPLSLRAGGELRTTSHFVDSPYLAGGELTTPTNIASATDAVGDVTDRYRHEDPIIENMDPHLAKRKEIKRQLDELEANDLVLPADVLNAPDVAGIGDYRRKVSNRYNELSEARKAVRREKEQEDNNFLGIIRKSLTGAGQSESAEMQESKEERNLATANRLLMQSEGELATAAKEQANKGIVGTAKNLGMGFGRGLFNAEAFTMGLSSMIDNASVLEVVNKADREGIESLSDDEEALLNAAMIKQVVDSSTEHGRAYTVANGLAQTIPYMIEFAMTGSVAGALTKGLNKKIMNVMAKWASKYTNKAARAAVKGVTGLATGSVKAAVQTPMQLSFMTKAVDNSIGEIKAKNDNGYAVYGGRENDAPLEAIGKAYASSFVTNLIETWGGAAMDDVLSLPFHKVMESDWYRTMMKSNSDKPFFNFLKASGRNMTPSEFLEEMLDQTLNSIITGEQELSQVWSGDNVLNTALVTLLMGTAIGGTTGVISARETKKINKRLASAEARIKSGNYTPEQIEQLREIAMQTPGRLSEWVDGISKEINDELLVINDKQRTGDIRRLNSLIEQRDFVIAAAQYNALTSGLRGRMQPMVDAATEQVNQYAHADSKYTIRVNYKGQEGFLRTGTLDIEQAPDGTVEDVKLPGQIYQVVLSNPDGTTTVHQAVGSDITFLDATPTEFILAGEKEKIYAPITQQLNQEQAEAQSEVQSEVENSNPLAYGTPPIEAGGELTSPSATEDEQSSDRAIEQSIDATPSADVSTPSPTALPLSEQGESNIASATEGEQSSEAIDIESLTDEEFDAHIDTLSPTEGIAAIANRRGEDEAEQYAKWRKKRLTAERAKLRKQITDKSKPFDDSKYKSYAEVQRAKREYEAKLASLRAENEAKIADIDAELSQIEHYLIERNKQQAEEREAENPLRNGIAPAMEKQPINTLSQYIARLIALGQKLRLSDEHSHGLMQELGIRSGSQEQRDLLSILSNSEGLTPEQLAQSIVENIEPEYAHLVAGRDVQDVRNEIIELIQGGVTSRVKAYQYVADVNSELQSQEDRYIEQQQIEQEIEEDAMNAMLEYEAELLSSLSDEDLAVLDELSAEGNEQSSGAASANVSTPSATPLPLSEQGESNIPLANDNNLTDNNNDSTRIETTSREAERGGESQPDEPIVGGVEEAYTPETTRTDEGTRAETIQPTDNGAAAEDDVNPLGVNATPPIEAGGELTTPSYKEERLPNGDKITIGYNSRGEVASVSYERNSKIVAVDNYDDGVLVSQTTYDTNGNAIESVDYNIKGEPMYKTLYQKGMAVKRVPATSADAHRPLIEYSPKQQIEKRVAEWRERIGVDIVVLHSVDEVKNAQARAAINRGELVAGWYEVSNGKVYVYAPNLSSLSEVDRTAIHEVVAHKGLRGLLGDAEYDTLCEKIWDMLPLAVQAKYLTEINRQYPKASEIERIRIATDEYIADLAEQTSPSKLEQSVWQRIVDHVRTWLGKHGIVLGKSENDAHAVISSLVRESYGKLRKNRVESGELRVETGEQSSGRAVEQSTDAKKNTTGSRDADDTRFLIVGERGAADTRRYNKRTVEKGFGGIWIDDKEEFAKFAKAVNNYAFEEDGEGVCYTDNNFYAYYRNIDGEAVPYVQINLNAEQSQDLVNKIQNDLEGTIHQRVEQSFDTVAGIVGREQTKGNSSNDAHTSSLNSTRGSRLANDISRKGTYLDSPSLFVKGKRVDRTEGTVRNDVRFRVAEVERRDKEYAAAVARGDVETAKKMVAEEAERKGYSSDSSYQGTSAFNGAAPNNSGYYETAEERKAAYDADEFEGDMSLGDMAKRDMNMVVGDDFLEQLRWLGRNRPASATALSRAIRKARADGDATIKMYRSVPNTVEENEFRNGDWITPDRAYAEENALVHGGEVGVDWRIIEQEVPIDDVWWDGNDIAEWGYDNGKDEVYKNTPNNRKSFEITYDNQGNLIPLSERFNENSGDVRFRVADDAYPIDVAREVVARVESGELRPPSATEGEQSSNRAIEQSIGATPSHFVDSPYRAPLAGGEFSTPSPQGGTPPITDVQGESNAGVEKDTNLQGESNADVRFRVSAEDAEQIAAGIARFKDHFNVLADIVEIEGRWQLREAYKHLSDAEFKRKFKDYKDLRGLYDPKTNKIYIFVENDINSFVTLSHEDTHAAIEKLYNGKDLADKLSHFVAEIEANHTDFCKDLAKEYSGDDYIDELVSYVIDGYIGDSSIENLLNQLSPEAVKELEPILKEIGYEPAKRQYYSKEYAEIFDTSDADERRREERERRSKSKNGGSLEKTSGSEQGYSQMDVSKEKRKRARAGEAERAIADVEGINDAYLAEVDAFRRELDDALEVKPGDDARTIAEKVLFRQAAEPIFATHDNTPIEQLRNLPNQISNAMRVNDSRHGKKRTWLGSTMFDSMQRLHDLIKDIAPKGLARNPWLTQNQAKSRAQYETQRFDATLRADLYDAISECIKRVESGELGVENSMADVSTPSPQGGTPPITDVQGESNAGGELTTSQSLRPNTIQDAYYLLHIYAQARTALERQAIKEQQAKEEAERIAKEQGTEVQGTEGRDYGGLAGVQAAIFDIYGAYNEDVQNVENDIDKLHVLAQERGVPTIEEFIEKIEALIGKPTDSNSPCAVLWERVRDISKYQLAMQLESGLLSRSGYQTLTYGMSIDNLLHERLDERVKAIKDNDANYEIVTKRNRKGEEYKSKVLKKEAKDKIKDLNEQHIAAYKLVPMPGNGIEGFSELVESGWMTQAEVDGLHRYYAYYMPLKGHAKLVAEDIEGIDYTRTTPRNQSKIKAVEGHSHLAKDPFTQLIIDTHATIQSVEQNRWKRDLYNVLMNAKPTKYYKVLNKGGKEKLEPYSGTPTQEELKSGKVIEVPIYKIEQTYYKVETGADGKQELVPYGEVTKDEKGNDVFIPQVPTAEQLASGEVVVFNNRRTRAKVDVSITRAQHDEHTTTVMVDGEPYTIFFYDKRIADALNGRNIGQPAKLWSLFEKIQWLNRWYAGLKTSMNPTFILVSNLMRDGMAMVSNNLMAHGFVHAWNSLKYRASASRFGKLQNAVRKWQKGELLTEEDAKNEMERYVVEFMKNGGAVNITQLPDYDTAKVDLIKDIEHYVKTGKIERGNAMLAAFERMAERVELAPRLATYIASRKIGHSIEESINDAKEVTVNFDRKGAASSWLGMVNMFFNASMQGVRRQFTLAKEHPARFIANYATIAIMAPVVKIALSWLLMSDDDEEKSLEDVARKYFAISPELRRRYNIILIGDTYIRLPQPVEFLPFITLGDQIANALINPDYRADHAQNAVDLVGAVLDTYTPTLIAQPVGFALDATVADNQKERNQYLLSSLISALNITPTIEPFIQSVGNYNFMGGTLYDTPYDKNSIEPAYQRARSYTSPFYIEMSRLLSNATGGNEAKAGYVDIAPEVFDNMLSIFGGMGEYGENAVAIVMNTINAMTGEEVDADTWMKSIPLVSRVYGGKTDDRYNKAMQSMFYDDMAAVERYNQLRKAYNTQELLDELNEEYSPEHQRYMADLNTMKKIADRIKKNEKGTTPSADATPPITGVQGESTGSDGEVKWHENANMQRLYELANEQYKSMQSGEYKPVDDPYYRYMYIRDAFREQPLPASHGRAVRLKDYSRKELEDIFGRRSDYVKVAELISDIDNLYKDLTPQYYPGKEFAKPKGYERIMSKIDRKTRELQEQFDALDISKRIVPIP